MIITQAPHKVVLATAITALGMIGTSAAAVIFQASATNTTEVTNTSNDLDALTITGDTDGGTLMMNNENGNFNNAGITSTSPIATLNTGALASTDTLTMTATVDSISGGFRANGFSFGLSDSNAFGSGAGGIVINLRANGATTTLTDGFGTVTPFTSFGITEASIKDGFTVTFSADVDGYRFSLADVVAQGANPVVDISGTFSGSEFVDNFGAGYLYATTQKYNLGTAATDTTFSVASIDVTSIPEPTSAALLGLGGLALFTRRRK